VADVSIYNKGPFPSGKFSFYSRQRARAREGLQHVS
jgi:hypothetical protein